ncbi:hypothetical protein BVI434_360078 [Burkholderia vietnamiensis]|nr:hypothetical protein BVI434_360078 [Burkholderia vietnamiensis]
MSGSPTRPRFPRPTPHATDRSTRESGLCLVPSRHLAVPPEPARVHHAVLHVPAGDHAGVDGAGGRRGAAAGVHPRHRGRLHGRMPRHRGRQAGDADDPRRRLPVVRQDRDAAAAGARRRLRRADGAGVRRVVAGGRRRPAPHDARHDRRHESDAGVARRAAHARCAAPRHAALHAGRDAVLVRAGAHRMARHPAGEGAVLQHRQLLAQSRRVPRVRAAVVRRRARHVVRPVAAVAGARRGRLRADDHDAGDDRDRHDDVLLVLRDLSRLLRRAGAGHGDADVGSLKRQSAGLFGRPYPVLGGRPTAPSRPRCPRAVQASRLRAK